mmetsp:Transcript_27429/g.56183  ORF Transcript_27429/g.56183 Transcript_27429/m.56183 type:complete len:403 (+) Transcript_27429:72-1280(+)
MGANTSRLTCAEIPSLPFNTIDVAFSCASQCLCANPLDQKKLAQKQRDQNGWSKDNCSDGICYAAAAVQVVAFANSRIFMADYQGAQSRYPRELHPDGITAAILEHRQKTDKNLQNGGHASKLIPEVYPHLKCEELLDMKHIETTLRTSARPVLMSFRMTGYAWNNFRGKDRGELSKGSILTHDMARNITNNMDGKENDPTKHAEMLEESGHAVVVMFLAEKNGKPLLAIKNSWGTETHAINGWLLMEADAAKEFKARFWDVYWTLDSLKKHPRYADLSQQFHEAPVDVRKQFVDYRKNQYCQCFKSCWTAIHTTMGAHHGISFPEDKLDVFERTVCGSSRRVGPRVASPAQSTSPSSLSSSTPLPMGDRALQSTAPCTTPSPTSSLLLPVLAVWLSYYFWT